MMYRVGSGRAGDILFEDLTNSQIRIDLWMSSWDCLAICELVDGGWWVVSGRWN